LDPLDRSILAHLQQDGRRPFREIGRALSVSETTVRSRVRRLQETGVLRILAFVDPLELGDSLVALIFAKADPDQHDAAVDAFAEMTEVSYISTIVGPFDLGMQVMCRGLEHLWELEQRIRRTPGVRDVLLMTEVKVHKFRYVAPGLASVVDGQQPG
jgi:Lrp/AsnC family transcriptional regulator, regulator for asnA, asnC and gidA